MELAVDLAEDGVDGAHDGDDVGDLVAWDDVREDGKVGERGPAPLHPVGLGAAVGDEIAADLAAGALDARVGLALGDAYLPHRLDAGARGDGPLGQAVQGLAYDLDGLAELDHPHPIAREAVARRLHGHLEVEVLVGGVGFGPADVVVDAGATDEWARDADLLRQLA